MFIGLVLFFSRGKKSGDGYIAITRSVKGFISLELVISLDQKELPLLEYVKSVLNIGRIKVYPNVGVVKYIIGRVDLQEVLLPLLFHHGLFFLTDTRRAQFERAFYILVNGLTKFNSIPTTVPTLLPLPLGPRRGQAIDYTNLPFFRNWIVGFTIAEGSFHVKGSGEFFFSLTQRNHTLLFDAFKLVFDTSRVIGGGDTPYMKFAVSSVRDLEKVVNFFSFSGLHPLVGNKRAQYLPPFFS